MKCQNSMLGENQNNRSNMSDREIYAFLKTHNCCNTCCARFLKGWKENYELCLEILKAKDIDFEEDRTEKCPSCLDILKSSFVESILCKLQEYSEFEVYDTPYIVIAIQFPIILNLSQLSIWIALLERFPGTISKKHLADLSLKDVFKNMLLPRVCEITKREYNENGLFVNIYLVADNENPELVKLLSVRPDVFQSRHRKEGRAHELITRNIFDREFTPEKLSMDLFKNIFPDLGHLKDVFIRLDKITFTGPTVFMAGRYCKFSRSLSQTPWVIEGKRIMDDSVQELIVEGVKSYFEVKYENFIFSSSGREDVDVRCLGNGRPFVLEILDSHKIYLPGDIASQLETKINCLEKGVTVSDLQMVKRDELFHIKSGEETKKKIYRALCKVDASITVDMLEKLDLPEGFVTHQWTPFRVLHRRPLLSRPRTIFSVCPKYYKNAETGHEMLIIDLVTQAGTYIKELVHGDFGRTSPNFTSIIGANMDIMALDVMGIDLDWPPVQRRANGVEIKSMEVN